MTEFLKKCRNLISTRLTKCFGYLKSLPLIDNNKLFQFLVQENMISSLVVFFKLMF